MRKPGRQQGIPRHRREGQTAIPTIGLMGPSIWADDGPFPDVEAVQNCDCCGDRCTGACDDEVDGIEEYVDVDIGTCGRCGAYHDRERVSTCHCGGYVG